MLNTTWNQVLELWQKMTASQQAMFSLVLVMVVAGFGLILWQHAVPDTAYIPLSVGKVFTVEELIHAEEALQQQGLTKYKREGQRLYVPQDQVEEYNSALIASGSMPQNWAEEWEKQYADLGPFANNKQMQDRKEIARAKLASQMISSLDDVSSANVVWDQQEIRRWPHESRSTATVFVRPKRGRELTQQMISGIRSSIAGMKADLSIQDVTVFDQTTGIAHKSDNPNDPLNNTIVSRITQLQEMYRQEIMRAVDYIDQVRVAVNVDIDKVRSAIRRKQEIQTKGGVTLVNTESKKDRTFSQAPVQAEPGQNANAGLDLKQFQGNQRNEQVVESDSTQITAPTFEVTQEDILGAMPQNVQVSVVIPEDYYLAVALKSGELSAGATLADQAKAVEVVKARVNAAVKTSVAKVIPAGTREKIEDGVDVSSYVRIDQNEGVISSAPGIMEQATYAINQWGSAALLVLFALWAMYMLNKSVNQVTKNTPELPEIKPIKTKEQTEEEEDYPGVELPETRSREQLQKIVRNNPDMAAAILNRWMAKVK
jgi:flagellar M-ring protein FliF